MARIKDKNRRALGRPSSPLDGAIEAVASINELKKQLNISDDDLAERIGVVQSSVYRALNRRPPKLTPTLQKLCKYAKKISVGQSRDVRLDARSQLAAAAEGIWDGSPEGLNKLLALLRNLEDLVARE